MGDRRRIAAISAGCLVMGLVGARAYAHHSFPGIYDVSDQWVIEGVATKFLYRNPHTFIFLEIVNDDGVAEEWHLEMPPMWALARNGMTAETIQPGDRLLVTCNPARHGGKSCGLGQRGGLYRSSDGFLYGMDPRSVPK